MGNSLIAEVFYSIETKKKIALRLKLQKEKIIFEAFKILFTHTNSASSIYH